MYATYFIPRENEHAFTKRFDIMVRKARQLGVTEPTYSAVKVLTIKRKQRVVVTDDKGRSEEVYLDVPVEHVAYTLTGELPQLAGGWTFVASLEHLGDKVLIRSISDLAVPAEYRNAGPDCDHCKTVRNRSYTYLVANEVGEYRHIGRSCLKDFLGHGNAESLATLFTMLVDFERNGGGFCEYDPDQQSRLSGYDIEAFLAATAAAIEEYGWVSRTMARERAIASTADTVCHHFDNKPGSFERETIPQAGSAGNHETAREAMAWVRELNSEGNDYFYNLQTIVELGFVPPQAVGFAASIVSSYYRATEQALFKSYLVADGNEWVGTVGERSEMLLTLLGVVTIEGFYGTSYIHRFADDQGNQVVWFASNPYVLPVTEGYPATNEHYAAEAEMRPNATYRVAATVKEHGTYRDRKQTKVTRVKVLPIAKAAKRTKKASKTGEKAPESPKAAPRRAPVPVPDAEYHSSNWEPVQLNLAF